MLSGLLVVVAATALTALVSRFMWWACRRSAVWSMAAGAILAVLALGCRRDRVDADAGWYGR
jgi:hypothetical protein